MQEKYRIRIINKLIKLYEELFDEWYRGRKSPEEVKPLLNSIRARISQVILGINNKDE